MLRTSYIEINKKFYKENLKYIKAQIGKNVKFCSVVKGNAYGHGLEEFVVMAESTGVDMFAVFDAHDAFIIKQIFPENVDIIIMGYIDNEDLNWAINNNVSFYVFNLNRFEKTIAIAKRLNKKAHIHIELETGLHRTGFEDYVIPKVVKMINNNLDFLDIQGVCTHYAGAESIANYYRIQNQIKKFNKLKNVLEAKKIKPKYYHTACSAAALTYEQTIMDLVRIGIAQYGFWPSPETQIYNLQNSHQDFKDDPLNQILTWKSVVMDIKMIKKGNFIGYGTSHLAKRNLKAAIIPIGYNAGFSRKLSDLGSVLIHGKKVAVVGLVNMNMITVDISHLPEVNVGDEVVIIGTQGEEKITISSFTEQLNYLNYELLTRLPESIPRKVVEK